MESILTYVIQVNILLTLLYFGYAILLKNLTFYNLNRVYFLIGSLYAFIYPFLNVKSWFAEKIVVPQGVIFEYLPLVIENSEPGFSLNDLFIVVIMIGSTVFLIKLFTQLASLLRIHLYSKPSQWREYLFRNVVFPITPFSFFNKIYLHKKQHQELELNDIFKHEYVHVKGHHSIDVLLFEIVLLICWYNPFVWLMRKAVRQNLEFLTDQQVLDKGVDRQTYQYSLLHVTKQGAQVGISNQFNFKTLKKRIMMMNKKRSSKLELSKYVFLLPILIIAGITFTVNQAEAKIEKVVVKLQETDLKQQIKQVFIESKSVDTNKVDTITFNAKESTENEQTITQQKNPGSRIQSENFFQNIVADSLKAPLVILDGNEMSKSYKSTSFNPNNLESVEVIKNESAKQLYGEKAKHGVIILTTKKNQLKDTVKSVQTAGKIVSVNLSGDKVSGSGKLEGDLPNAKFEVDGENPALKGQVQGIGIKSNKPRKTFTEIALLDTEGLDNKEYRLDGKKISTSDLARIDPNNIESVVVNKNVEPPLVQFISKVASKENISVVEEKRAQPISASAGDRKDEKFIENKNATPNRDQLIVINGVPKNYKEYKKLKSSEIENSILLTDDAAKAIYGPKAKNGVVIITTKY
ncbi:M56 family metallopeptidase [Sphingobacterium endophyticum]|uniref:M56 family metallopeptidase n=1 Tax=Sphingobacterium endophyticum TaxID=2546448 RepID=UPI0012E26D64|nr:M56 family metallopeptidase [Sphingobacterium endophyticum]